MTVQEDLIKAEEEYRQAHELAGEQYQLARRKARQKLAKARQNYRSEYAKSEIDFQVAIKPSWDKLQKARETLKALESLLVSATTKTE